jgi:uracil-DNA glycosylase family 4
MPIVDTPNPCTLCPRLAGFVAENRMKFPGYFNGPVPNFGDGEAEVMIVGLAPGLHGANWSGRPFTGDAAGDLLFETLHKTGFSTGTYDKRPDDGLQLNNILICNCVKCVPPENKPTAAEITTCRPFLVDQIKAMPNLKVMVSLGKIAHDSTLKALDITRHGLKMKDFQFGHEAVHTLPSPLHGGGLIMIDSYHCSRYNTNTGRLTAEMFTAVFERAKSFL